MNQSDLVTAYNGVTRPIVLDALNGASFGSVEQLGKGEVRLNPAMLMTSVLLIGLSVTLSRYIKKRETQRNLSPWST